VHRITLTIAAVATQTLVASVASPVATIGATLFQPGAGPQVGGAPFVRPGFTIYPPGATILPPQLTNPAANHYPSGAQTCVATPYTCPAPAPNTPGNACTCPTNGGGTVRGIVH
jgi:hypothetical protein